MFVSDFVWSLSNDIILSVSYDGTARLWNVASGACIRVINDITGGELHCCLFHPLNNNMFVVSFFMAGNVFNYHNAALKMELFWNYLALLLLSYRRDIGNNYLYLSIRWGVLILTCAHQK